jgi:type IV pilus assembly protein PilE
MRAIDPITQVKKDGGFTLVELMIVVAIIGVLTTVAYPSYRGFINASNRATAQADLMSLAAAMERHKAAVFTYNGAAVANADTGKPAIYHQHSPSTELVGNRQYDLNINQASSGAYLIEAKPVTGQTQALDGSLFLYSDGRRSWDADNSGGITASEFCWSC